MATLTTKVNKTIASRMPIQAYKSEAMRQRAENKALQLGLTSLEWIEVTDKDHNETAMCLVGLPGMFKLADE